MTDTKRLLKVFLCHTNADSDAVHPIYDRLTNDGADVWLDKESLLPGQNSKLEIDEIIHVVDIVVVCLSKQFEQEGRHWAEMKDALERAKEQPEGEIFIIPLRIEICEIPANLHKLHWVDWFDNAGYELLTKALHLRAKKVGAIFDVELAAKLDLEKLNDENLVGSIDYWNDLGIAYVKKGDYSKGIEYIERSLIRCQEKGDMKSEVSILNNLAVACERNGDLVRAVELLELKDSRK